MNDINVKLKQILEDLYALDPEFRKYEARLIQILTELLRSKPNVAIDAEFAAQLRRRLMAKATVLSSPQTASISFFRKYSMAISGTALVMAAILVGGGYYLKNNPLTQQSVLFTGDEKNSLFASDVQISKVQSNAFGKLELAMAFGRGGGGGGGAAAIPTQEPAAAPEASVADVSAKGMGGDGMIMPAFENFRYVYKGEEFSVPQGSLAVLKKIKGFSSAVDAGGLLRQLNFGNVNMDSFSGTKLQSLNIVEDKDYGYSFYINVDDGMISISENWLKWPDPYRNCRDEACYQDNRLKMSDIPDDATIISLANQFIADHNISRENYGEPIVGDMWKREYERASDKSQFYIPDVISVVYPLKLNGQEVYDEGGYKNGLSLNVNVRQKRVSGVNELSVQKYQSSEYPAQTNIDELLKVAERGGYYGNMYIDPAAKTVDVELGTPQIAYLRAWQYKDGLNNELYVPALVFPVVKAPQSPYFYRQNVVVPLVQDLLQDNSDPVKIMPAQ